MGKMSKHFLDVDHIEMTRVTRSIESIFYETLRACINLSSARGVRILTRSHDLSFENRSHEEHEFFTKVAYKPF